MATKTTDRQLITLASACARMEVSVRTLRRAIATGELPAYRLPGGRGLRVDVADLDAMLTRVPTVAAHAS